MDKTVNFMALLPWNPVRILSGIKEIKFNSYLYFSCIRLCFTNEAIIRRQTMQSLRLAKKRWILSRKPRKKSEKHYFNQLIPQLSARTPKVLTAYSAANKYGATGESLVLVPATTRTSLCSVDFYSHGFIQIAYYRLKGTEQKMNRHGRETFSTV